MDAWFPHCFFFSFFFSLHFDCLKHSIDDWFPLCLFIFFGIWYRLHQEHLILNIDSRHFSNIFSTFSYLLRFLSNRNRLRINQKVNHFECIQVSFSYTLRCLISPLRCLYGMHALQESTFHSYKNEERKHEVIVFKWRVKVWLKPEQFKLILRLSLKGLGSKLHFKLWSQVSPISATWFLLHSILSLRGVRIKSIRLNLGPISGAPSRFFYSKIHELRHKPKRCVNSGLSDRRADWPNRVRWMARGNEKHDRKNQTIKTLIARCRENQN